MRSEAITLAGLIRANLVAGIPWSDYPDLPRKDRLSGRKFKAIR
jgi:hypothetical protein